MASLLTLHDAWASVCVFTHIHTHTQARASRSVDDDDDDDDDDDEGNCAYDSCGLLRQVVDVYLV